MKKYAVSIEACHILTKEKAEVLAEQIRHRLNDIDEDIYVCISDYEQVRSRSEKIISIKKRRLM
ncbi:hypothetical protein KAR91_47400 [Candidatus Pacearchaeota archaeon]|nr:hypothetical protein [Candidatus Pacearchaeota archaeon]